jgi:hypothetical protein
MLNLTAFGALETRKIQSEFSGLIKLEEEDTTFLSKVPIYRLIAALRLVATATACPPLEVKSSWTTYK